MCFAVPGVLLRCTRADEWVVAACVDDADGALVASGLPSDCQALCRLMLGGAACGKVISTIFPVLRIAKTVSEQCPKTCGSREVNTIECDAGKYADAGGVECIAGEAGKYNPATASTKASACMICSRAQPCLLINKFEHYKNFTHKFIVIMFCV
jgi:hypothetical protein